VDTPDDLVRAFTEAVPFALRELTGVEAVVRDAGPAAGAATADLAAAVGLTTAAGEGRLVLCLPGRTAEELVRRILAGTTTDLSPDLVRDCAGEVANVVAGQAKTLLVGSPCHFTLSPPRVGADPPAAGPGAWAIQFDSDAGEFTVHLDPPQ
jgi:chemotaxis protein CheX